MKIRQKTKKKKIVLSSKITNVWERKTLSKEWPCLTTMFLEDLVIFFTKRYEILSFKSSWLQMSWTKKLPWQKTLKNTCKLGFSMSRATLDLSSITKQNNQRQEHNECKKNVEWNFILIIYHENINKNERNKVMVQDMLNKLKIMKGAIFIYNHLESWFKETIVQPIVQGTFLNTFLTTHYVWKLKGDK